MVRSCGAGKVHRFVWRCVAPKKGRVGQGKGRPRSGHECLYGRQASGLCKRKPRTKAVAAGIIQKLFRAKQARKQVGAIKERIASMASAAAAKRSFVPRRSSRLSSK